MPRTPRASVADMWYEPLNRDNRREVVFHRPADYDAFVKAMADATARWPVDLLGYCLMPNHFHLVIRTHADGNLGRWVRWLLVAHAQRYHRHYQTTGHVRQGASRHSRCKTTTTRSEYCAMWTAMPCGSSWSCATEDWRWSSFRGGSGVIRGCGEGKCSPG